MQLETGEKSILAYFVNDCSARQAMKTLQSQGYPHVRLDCISNVYEKPKSKCMVCLTDLHGVSYRDKSKGPLHAADPAISGLSSAEVPEAYSYMVTVVTDEQGLPYARESLLACGALLNG
jgi:hypothetical protein